MRRCGRVSFRAGRRAQTYFGRLGVSAGRTSSTYIDSFWTHLEIAALSLVLFRSVAPGPVKLRRALLSPSPNPHTARMEDKPPVVNYVVGFLLVGLAWGLTTPFIRRAARAHRPPHHPALDAPEVRESAVRRKLYGWFFAVVDLLRNPAYVVPLGLNVTGSVWFFLLIGKAGEFAPDRGEVGTLGVLTGCRAEPHGPDCEFPRLLVYGAGGVVGRGQGHQPRFVLCSRLPGFIWLTVCRHGYRDAALAGRHRALRAEQIVGDKWKP